MFLHRVGEFVGEAVVALSEERLKSWRTWRPGLSAAPGAWRQDPSSATLAGLEDRGVDCRDRNPLPDRFRSAPRARSAPLREASLTSYSGTRLCTRTALRLRISKPKKTIPTSKMTPTNMAHKVFSSVPANG